MLLLFSSPAWHLRHFLPLALGTCLGYLRWSLFPLLTRTIPLRATGPASWLTAQNVSEKMSHPPAKITSTFTGWNCSNSSAVLGLYWQTACHELSYVRHAEILYRFETSGRLGNISAQLFEHLHAIALYSIQHLNVISSSSDLPSTSQPVIPSGSQYTSNTRWKHTPHSWSDYWQARWVRNLLVFTFSWKLNRWDRCHMSMQSDRA